MNTTASTPANTNAMTTGPPSGRTATTRPARFPAGQATPHHATARSEARIGQCEHRGEQHGEHDGRRRQVGDLAARNDRAGRRRPRLRCGASPITACTTHRPTATAKQADTNHTGDRRCRRASRSTDGLMQPADTLGPTGGRQPCRHEGGYAPGANTDLYRGIGDRSSGAVHHHIVSGQHPSHRVGT